MIMFLVQLFDMSDANSEGARYGADLKILVSSNTNVAVDRILEALLDFDFVDFVRVGSAKKIAKRVLPFSIHTGSDKQELRDLNEMLKTGGLTAAEKLNVRRAIDKIRKGDNQSRLQRVRVVGATCAASCFSCMDNMKFHTVLLDECCQITEPSSLLPVARFQCESLVLVGDPNQLCPTITGANAIGDTGLEQTLFHRLMKIGVEPIMLRTQYRCHPAISAIANDLFYSGVVSTLEGRVGFALCFSFAFFFPFLSFFLSFLLFLFSFLLFYVQH
eukprot:m.430987 g.430987  ORF g.430987 m.430987 type:complete len:274 (+) comp20242_c0_seq10:237-1058(+)